MVGVMLDPSGPFVDPDSARTISAEEHNILADYLAENFGPDSPSRVLRLDVEYPLDEQTLSTAMFIEYLTPLHPGADLSPAVPESAVQTPVCIDPISTTTAIYGVPIALSALAGWIRAPPSGATSSSAGMRTTPKQICTARRKEIPIPSGPTSFLMTSRSMTRGYVFWAEVSGPAHRPPGPEHGQDGPVSHGS